MGEGESAGRGSLQLEFHSDYSRGKLENVSLAVVIVNVINFASVYISHAIPEFCHKGLSYNVYFDKIYVTTHLNISHIAEIVNNLYIFQFAWVSKNFKLTPPIFPSICRNLCIIPLSHFLPSVLYLHGTKANSVDPDQTPQDAARSDQDLHGFYQDTS